MFQAATRLFGERGVERVSMGAIANEVGLARSSLYRYFPKKSSILVRWFEQSMGPLLAESIEIAGSTDDRAERFDRWIELQIKFLLDPTNSAMIRATLATDDLADEDRQLIGQRHRSLYRTLHDIVDSPAGQDEAEPSRLRVLLIVELLRSVDQLVARGTEPKVLASEVLRAARLIAGIHAPN